MRLKCDISYLRKYGALRVYRVYYSNVVEFSEFIIVSNNQFGVTGMFSDDNS